MLCECTRPRENAELFSTVALAITCRTGNYGSFLRSDDIANAAARPRAFWSPRFPRRSRICKLTLGKSSPGQPVPLGTSTPPGVYPACPGNPGQFEIPLAAWQVHRTAWDLYAELGDREKAAQHRARAQEIIMSVADSFEPGEPLRETFLSAPPIRHIFEQHTSA